MNTISIEYRPILTGIEDGGTPTPFGHLYLVYRGLDVNGTSAAEIIRGYPNNGNLTVDIGGLQLEQYPDGVDSETIQQDRGRIDLPFSSAEAYGVWQSLKSLGSSIHDAAYPYYRDGIIHEYGLNSNSLAASLLSSQGFNISEWYPNSVFVTFPGVSTILGSGESDTLRGFEGSDVLIGGPGSDMLDGGGFAGENDNDESNYAFSPSGIVVDVTSSSGEVIDDGFGASDDLANIEHIVGSQFDDLFYGFFAYASTVTLSDGTRISKKITFDGASGSDTMDYSRFSENITIALDAQYASKHMWTSETDTEYFDGIENAIGGQADDLLFGNYGANTILGMQGNDLITGMGGADSLDGGMGHDTIYGGADFAIIRGDDGNDVLYAYNPVEYSINHRSNATLYGGGDGDTLFGAEGANVLRGDDGNDIVYANGDNDLIYGNVGNDTLYGGWGDDVMWGGQDHDYIQGGLGKDTLYGGAGNDTILVYESNEGNSDVANGGDGEDLVFGGEGSNILYGEGDNDLIHGNGGSDFIDAGHGDDRLNGGWGSDYLIGGNGVDVFFFTEGFWGSDTIGDFEVGVDVIDMRDLSMHPSDLVVSGDTAVTIVQSLLHPGDNIVLIGVAIDEFNNNDSFLW